MTTELEARLTESMHHQVDGLALSTDILDRATRRHQRRTTTIRIGYALGAAGLAGALAAGLSLGGGAAEPPAVVQAAPASMRLANAATASDNISYRIHLKSGSRVGDGAFDPRTASGYFRVPQDDSVTTEIMVNGTRYIGGEPPLGKLPADKGRGEKYGRYGQYPGKHKSLSLFGNGDAVVGAAAPNPAALFKALSQANATTSENPDGTFHFEYATTTGDVALNSDGRIARMTLTTTWRSTAKGRLDTGRFDTTIELSDYGLKVKVKRPADVVPTS
ncbi:hypothetical protein [Actinoplanes friuliensis]|jgi:hypothetical protein|nr:hypothetical protein [Actinoplanes friuliensis]